MSAGNFSELAHELQLGAKFLQMYGTSHPRTEATLDKLEATLGGWLASQPRLHIAASGGRTFLDGVPVESPTIHITALYRQLTERNIGGFLIRAGITSRELKALLHLLVLKPARIDEMGGPEKILRDQGVVSVEISQTRYEEIIGEGGDESRPPEVHPTPGSRPPESDAPKPVLDLGMGPGAPSFLPNAVRLAALWNQALAEAEAGRTGADPLEKLDLEPLSRTAEDLGMGEAFPEQAVVDSLRQALAAQSAETQLGALAGAAALPTSQAGLRMALQILSPEVFAQAVMNLLAGGRPFQEIKAPLMGIVGSSPHRSTLLHALATQLRARGVDAAQIQSMLQQLDWDRLPTEAKVEKLLQGKGFYELTPDQTLKFLKELLDKGRDSVFMQILEAMLQGLAIEDGTLRQNVGAVLAGVSHWILDPGLPEGAEAALLDGLKGNFGWEPLPHIHALSTEGLSALLASSVYRGELAQTLAVLQELKDLLEFLGDDTREWRERGLHRLQATLASEELVDRAVREGVGCGQARLLAEVLPYLEFLGTPGGAGVVRALGNEPDRQRRGRLMEMIRSLGPLAIESLGSVLASPSWFVVRNALNLLGELGGSRLLPEVIQCLGHPDGRARRAAVRAAWKVGGPDAEADLLGLLPRTDPETQMEVLFALGQIKSALSIAPLSDFIRDGQVQARLRLKAIEILGQLGHADAIPPLVEMFRRKGFSIFASPVEPPELRLAAARALGAVGGPQALGALAQALQHEPKGADRTAMEAFLRPGRP